MRSKANKKKPEKTGPKMFVCPYCNERVSRRKSTIVFGGRICNIHFCDICKRPTRPENSIEGLVDGEIGYRCKRHKCHVCDRRVPTDLCRIIDKHVVCNSHYCTICGDLTTPKTAVVINGKSVCRRHPTPVKGR